MATGRGKDKKQEEVYRKAADAEREKYVESPLEAKLRIRAENFLTQSAGSGGIESIDALKPHLDLYNSAVSDQQNDRQSTGILQLARGGDPNQAAAFNTYMKFRRQQDAAGQLENAYNQTSADITGQSFNLAGMANQRLSDRAGMAQQAYQTYLNKPVHPSMLQQGLGFAMGGLQAAGGGAGIAKMAAMF